MDIMHDLRLQNARDAEALRARCLLTEIIEETVGRMAAAGFAPKLVMADDALIELRVDASRWGGGVARPLTNRVDGGLIAAEVPVGPVVAAVQAAAKSDVKVYANGRPVALARTDAWVWTQDAINKMISLRKAGVVRTDIARQLGVSVKALDAKIGKLKAQGVDVGECVRPVVHPFKNGAAHRKDGVVLAAYSEAEDQEIADLYARGVTLEGIAKELGRSRGAISKRLTHLRELGRIGQYRSIVPTKNKWSKDRKDRLRDLWSKKSVKDIAAEFGLTTGAISGMAHRLGLGPCLSSPSPTPGLRLGGKQKSEQEASGIAPSDDVPVLVQPPIDRVPEAELPKPDLPEGVAHPVEAGSWKGPSGSAGVRPLVFTAAMGRLWPTMTKAQRAELIAAHVAGLPDAKGFDPDLDLELCEAVFGGEKISVFCTDMGIDSKQALARFDAIVSPFREALGTKHLPIEAGELILPALRDKVKARRGVAA